jgi:hypothetical protein
VALPTIEPNPTAQSNSPSPTIVQPSAQPLLSLFSSITDNPLLFIIIIFAIVLSISLAVWSGRKQKRQTIEEPAPDTSNVQQTEKTNLDSAKFCIFCGSSNKSYAVFCESCGKQIAK